MLYIVRDKVNLADKNSGLFAKALARECGEQGVAYAIMDSIVDETTPTVVLEPTGVDTTVNYNNVDIHTTAQVVGLIIAENLATCSVCILGYGKVVGKPLFKMLSKHMPVSFIKSDTPCVPITEDVVVVATPGDVPVVYDLSDKIVIDVAGTYKGECKKYYSMRHIGKETVKSIVSRAK